jgi:RHS repeat-associated protein
VGNKLTSTDPNGVTATWAYTPLNQVATISYSGSSAHSVTYSYDADGQETGMADATGSSSNVYDAFGELTSTTNGAGQTTGYGYNADAEVTSITYPLPAAATWATSDTMTYTVDNADRLISATDFNGNRISIGHTADGQLNSLTLGTTGDTITTSYDDTGMPSLIKLKNATATLQSFSYSDAPAGDIVTETDTPSSGLTPATYGYDATGRVTSMTPGSGTALSYGFDNSGNLTTLPNGADATSGYDHASELTSSVLSGVTTTYTYNADGQLLGAAQAGTAVASATWNGAARLTSYDSPSANMSAATYDGNGLRASATTGAGTKNFTWNLSSGFPRLLMDSNNAYIYAKGSTPAEQVNLATGAVTYLVADSLGSVRGTANSAGNLTATTSYDAWGNPETTGGVTAVSPIGYAGGYTDPTGLIYLLARYYQPTTGQFISVDPELTTTRQPYSYGNDDPVITVDPTGAQPDDKHGSRCNGNPYGWCDLKLSYPVTDNNDGSTDEEIIVTTKTSPFDHALSVRYWVQIFHDDATDSHPINTANLNVYAINPDASRLDSGGDKLDLHKSRYTHHLHIDFHRSFQNRWMLVEFALALTCDSCTNSVHADDWGHTNWAYCDGPKETCRFDKNWIPR